MISIIVQVNFPLEARKSGYPMVLSRSAMLEAMMEAMINDQ